MPRRLPGSLPAVRGLVDGDGHGALRSRTVDIHCTAPRSAPAARSRGAPRFSPAAPGG
ncbi:hypothetical protein [Kitasatospora sp. NPDC088351]|uniref:hypothetical protein n=1 Tax=Kitasatospora sp. NPDC088351 TaxID=3155180 RepID=UPI003431453E